MRNTLFIRIILFFFKCIECVSQSVRCGRAVCIIPANRSSWYSHVVIVCADARRTPQKQSAKLLTQYTCVDFHIFNFFFFILSFSITPTSYFVDRRVLKISKYWFFFSVGGRALACMHVHVRQRTVVCGTFFLCFVFFFSVFLYL